MLGSKETLFLSHFISLRKRNYFKFHCKTLKNLIHSINGFAFTLNVFQLIRDLNHTASCDDGRHLVVTPLWVVSACFFAFGSCLWSEDRERFCRYCRIGGNLWLYEIHGMDNCQEQSWFCCSLWRPLEGAQNACGASSTWWNARANFQVGATAVERRRYLFERVVTWAAN